MERKYYKNGTEAPQFLETENGIIYNYNSEANHEMLIADGYEISDDIQNAVPKSITMRQAKLALLSKGLLSLVEGAIDSMESEAVNIEWEYATVIEYDNSLVNSLVSQLGINKDDFFIYANTL